MILSMTGYGKSTIECKGKRFTAEIKSLNSKQMDLSIRIPQQFREFELPIRSIISQRLERGKVDVVISVETISADSTTTINQSAAAAYKLQIEELAKNLQIPPPQDWLSVLIKLPDVLKTDVSEIDDAEKDTLFSVVNNAIEGLVEFRTQEGNRLATFFEDKIHCIQELLNEVPQYENERVTKIKSRIQESLEKLGDVDYDKNRFEQEMIFYIQKKNFVCRTISTTLSRLSTETMDKGRNWDSSVRRWAVKSTLWVQRQIKPNCKRLWSE